MSRWVVLAALAVTVALGACGARRAAEPAWPSSAGHIEADEDDGESLEPQHAMHVSALERAEDRTPSTEAAATLVVELPALPVEISPPFPATTSDTVTVPGDEDEIDIEVIELEPDDSDLEP